MRSASAGAAAHTWPASPSGMCRPEVHRIIARSSGKIRTAVPAREVMRAGLACSVTAGDFESSQTPILRVDATAIPQRHPRAVNELGVKRQAGERNSVDHKVGLHLLAKTGQGNRRHHGVGRTNSVRA